jgi:hypothetical protein
MAEATQFTFTHKELITFMIKDKGIHDGRWMLLVNFAMTAGYFGPSPTELSPGTIVTATGLGIQRVLPGQPETAEVLIVDAATVNPRERASASTVR